jgi:hypothetical protein
MPRLGDGDGGLSRGGSRPNRYTSSATPLMGLGPAAQPSASSKEI